MKRDGWRYDVEEIPGGIVVTGRRTWRYRLTTAAAALALAVAVVWFVAMCVETPTASAHYRSCTAVERAPAVIRIACKRHNVYHAALLTWCGSSYRPCWLGVKMFTVAGCETGYTYDKWATNGQYHGYWQMGRSARARCGEVLGRDPWTQARAARCWLLATSLDAWTCA